MPKRTSLTAGAFQWACPVCRRSIDIDGENACCKSCTSAFTRRNGIWHFLPDATAYEAFLKQYELVRRSEEWGRCDDAYYRALPKVDGNDPNRRIWKVRARTFRCFLLRIVMPMEGRIPLRVVDLGAGNGWLAYRLALRGHRVAAVDLRIDDFDGLGAHVHYDADYFPVRAEYERLPFTDGGFDLATFNASLHYAEDTRAVLHEALRVLRPGGKLVLLDSPVYPYELAGREMVRKRESELLSRCGFASNALKSENFFTHARLGDLAREADITWSIIHPHLGVRRAVRSLTARITGEHPPADFPVLSAEKRPVDEAVDFISREEVV